VCDEALFATCALGLSGWFLVNGISGVRSACNGCVDYPMGAEQARPIGDCFVLTAMIQKYISYVVLFDIPADGFCYSIQLLVPL
jgi:hypothetical protein